MLLLLQLQHALLILLALQLSLVATADAASSWRRRAFGRRPTTTDDRRRWGRLPFPATIPRGGSLETGDTSPIAREPSVTEAAVSGGSNLVLAELARTTTSNSTALGTSATSNSTTAVLAASPPLPAWKAALPPILQRKGPKTLQRLILGDVEIFLLGTAHVSNDSCRDVQVLLEAVQPSCILVELCEARIPLLDGSDTPTVDEAAAAAAANETAPTKLSWRERMKQVQDSQGGSQWQAMCTLLLTSVQEDYADTLGVELGGEFRAAHVYWKAQHAQQPAAVAGYSDTVASAFPALILGDRPLSLTLIRAWESLTWWPKLKVMVGLLWSSLRKPDPQEIRDWLAQVLREESDVLTTSLAELRQHFPTLHTTIITERDAWLACKVVQTCRILRSSRQPRVVVAIVGAGHVPGMVVRLTTPDSRQQTTEEILNELCQTKRWLKDEVVQTQAMPQWVNEVSQVQDQP
jgi:pheromone shutdown protein TraB